MRKEKIIVGDEIEASNPFGSRVFKVKKISECGKWAITEGGDYFRSTADEKGFTRKKGYRSGNQWYEPSWRVLRLVAI